MKSIKILRILKTFEIMIKLTDLSRIPKKNKGLLICGKQFGIYSYNIKCCHQLIHHLTVHLVYVKYYHWFFYEYFGTNLAQSNFLIQTVKKEFIIYRLWKEKRRLKCFQINCIYIMRLKRGIQISIILSMYVKFQKK